jgi:hypothetical protein
MAAAATQNNNDDNDDNDGRDKATSKLHTSTNDVQHSSAVHSNNACAMHALDKLLHLNPAVVEHAQVTPYQASKQPEAQINSCLHVSNCWINTSTYVQQCNTSTPRSSFTVGSLSSQQQHAATPPSTEHAATSTEHAATPPSRTMSLKIRLGRVHGQP